jgi:hypothetical protein
VHFQSSQSSDPLRKLSQELHALAERFNESAVSLAEVMNALGARASGLLVIILALPFCAPITIPGLSTPFGLVILLITARFALGLPPWLPRRLLALRLPPRFFRRVLEGASRFVGWIEHRLRPRWPWLSASVGRVRAHTAMIGIAALLLLLPLGGIPFTNTLPALAIVIGTLGLMERDGLAIVIGYLLVVATGIYFGLFADALYHLLEQVKHHLWP